VTSRSLLSDQEFLVLMLHTPTVKFDPFLWARGQCWLESRQLLGCKYHLALETFDALHSIMKTFVLVDVILIMGIGDLMNTIQDILDVWLQICKVSDRPNGKERVLNGWRFNQMQQFFKRIFFNYANKNLPY